jgi:ATP-dependent DNA helicase RecG
MPSEGTEFDKKSLKSLTRSHPDWDGLAGDCVAFANARGGRLYIGIEDDHDQPPAHQRVPESLVEQLRKRIPQVTVNVTVSVRKAVADNGGEFIELRVLRAPGIACTSSGQYFIRVADETKPVMPDELQRLLNDKSAFVWEAQPSQSIRRQHAAQDKRAAFLQSIRESDRVSSFVKGKSDDELLAYYLLTKGQFLTNLGVLWIGRRDDRATLPNAPIVQFLKFDEAGEKVNKLVWDDFSRNPMDLIEAIWTQVPDWRESYEFPDGMFRTQVPHFDEVVVRELLANALVHRPYTTRGDIFINLYPDRLEVHNPGLLPLGVTPANILHTSIKRNELLAKVFYDLKLMEREGSGYDRMYEALLSTGRPGPVVKEGDDRVVVTVQRRIVKPEVIDFMIKANQTFSLTQKERITLGLIARQEAVTLAELTRLLELRSAEERRPWLGRLLELRIVKTTGRTSGTKYFVDADLLRKLDFQGKTTLKAIEPHRLRELVLSDLRRHRDASISEIHGRIGTEIPRRDLRRELSRLAASGEIRIHGTQRWTRYSMDKMSSNAGTLGHRNRPRSPRRN